MTQNVSTPAEHESLSRGQRLLEFVGGVIFLLLGGIVFLGWQVGSEDPDQLPGSELVLLFAAFLGYRAMVMIYRAFSGRRKTKS